MQKIAILFPGGGSHYVGMGKVFFNAYKIVREVFEEASDVLGYDLRRICFEGSMEVLSTMEKSQPAIFTTSMAAYRVYEQEIGIKPTFAAGHSLGEYSALCAAGGMSFSDTINVVKRRGELLQLSGLDADKGMAAISKIDRGALENEIKRIKDHQTKLFISVYNSSHQLVVAGGRNEIRDLVNNLAHTEAEAVILNISSPSHCPLMNVVVKEFKAALGQYSFCEPNFPIISNVTGRPYQPTDKISELLCEHLVKPVQWESSIRWLYDQHINAVIDIGPQNVLRNINHFIVPSLKSFGFDGFEDINEVKVALAIDSQNLQSVLKYYLSVAAGTKNSNHHSDTYHQDVIIPYNQLKEMAAKSAELIPSLAEMKKAKEALHGILVAKGVSESRIENYLKRFSESAEV